jgi:hypothetical protein
MGMVFCPADYSVNGGAGFSLLFKSWVITSRASYLLACLGVFLMGALRQGLGCLRAALPALAARLARRPAAPAPAAAAAEDARGLLEERPLPPALRRSVAYLAADAALLGAALLLAYLNMLVAMAYDAGLLASLVAGEAVAHFALSLGGLVPAQHTPSEPSCHS